MRSAGGVKRNVITPLKKRREQRIRELFRDPKRGAADQTASRMRTEKAWQAWQAPPSKHQWLIKLYICLFLYALIWGASHIDYPIANRIHTFTIDMLTKPMDVTSTMAWYKRYLGKLPALLPAFGGTKGGTGGEELLIPVAAAIPLSRYSEDAQGIWIATGDKAPVAVIADGLVYSVTESPTTGLTITIRHADGLESVYGWLGQVYVKKHDWLSRGAYIGTAKAGAGTDTGKLYLALKRQGVYIDPEEVIPFD